jgi:hypothetical protein
MLQTGRQDSRPPEYCTWNTPDPGGEPRTPPQTTATYPSTWRGSNTPSRWQVPIHARRIRYIPSTVGRHHRSFSNHRWTQYTDARYAPVRWTKQPHLPNTSQSTNTSISNTKGYTMLTIIPVEYYSMWTGSRHLKQNFVFVFVLYL